MDDFPPISSASFYTARKKTQTYNIPEVQDSDLSDYSGSESEDEEKQIHPTSSDILVSESDSEEEIRDENDGDDRYISETDLGSDDKDIEYEEPVQPPKKKSKKEGRIHITGQKMICLQTF